MDADPLDELLDLESSLYTEGYEAGVADGQRAGMIEGKVFGIEKGYEKALEMGRLHGRALVWTVRTHGPRQQPQATDGKTPESGRHLSQSNEEAECSEHSARPEQHELPDASVLVASLSDTNRISPTARLHKHIESLLETTSGDSISTENTDDAVAVFDERLRRARTKAKVIANIVGDPLHVAGDEKTGIEDSEGLSARH